VADKDFNELSGRIEGVGRALMILVSMLEDKGIVNGRNYCSALRRTEKQLCFQEPGLASAKRTLLETAKSLDSARTVRRKLAAQD